MFTSLPATVLSLILFSGPEVAQEALAAGQVLRLEFPDLPVTLQALCDSTVSEPAVSLRLPDDYSPEGKFPLFVHLEGGHGGIGGNLRVPLQVTQGKGYVAANFPLFKRLAPDPEVSWSIAIGADDASLIVQAYRAILDRLNTVIPNLDARRSILGGHSNGAHAIAALLSVLDETTLASFGGFFFIDGGLDWSSFKRTEVLGGHSLLFLVGGGHGGETDEWWREHMKLRATFLMESARRTAMDRWAFVIKDGVGHEFANEYFSLLRDWAGGVGREVGEDSK